MGSETLGERKAWGAKRLGTKRLGVVLGDQAALPCLAMALGTRARWRASVAGISGCVSSEMRRESWLRPALARDLPGQRRRADRRCAERRRRSAHDRLIVLASQRHPATLAIAPRAPHLGDRVAHLAQIT